MYSRETLDWIEAEWAFHLHGRSAFLSREDFLQLQAWAAEGVPAEAVVGAMEGFFERRAKRAKPRTFVALAHLARDVEKARKLRTALQRTEGPSADLTGWEGVADPLRSDPKAWAAFEALRRVQAGAPAPDSPGYLDHFDAERQARRALLDLAEAALGARAEALRDALRERLRDAKIPEATLVWQRAWDHHWGRTLIEAWNLPD